MVSAKRLIERELRKLVGLGVYGLARAADMLTVGFGKRRPRWIGWILTKRRRRVALPEFALHVQDPWRIEIAGSLFTERFDLWRPPGEADRRSPRVDWNRDYDTKPNLQDQRMKLLRRRHPYDPRARRLVVESVRADSRGGAVIDLSHDVRLAIRPTRTSGEAWRVFRPGSRSKHFVVLGGGVVEG